jgi:hypothetical protein
MQIKDNKLVYFLGGILFSIILLFIFSFDSSKSSISGNSNDAFPHEYRIISPYIPEQIDFCGERVPLENDDVRERVEREFVVQTYFHSATIFYLKRINRWFPVIEKILKEKGVPDDFKYLALAESGLENVVSPAGAVGFWQFMDYNAPKYKLIVNDEIDERYNVEKLTYAACDYILESKNKLGSWTLAAAAYNRGLNGIKTQLERQKTSNYFNLVLNNETNRYIPRIVALKYIMENPKIYGFDVKEEQLYKPYSTRIVKLDTSVTNFADYAKLHGINYKTLKLFNPWLRENFVVNKDKTEFLIKIPQKGTFEIIPN